MAQRGHGLVGWQDQHPSANPRLGSPNHVRKLGWVGFCWVKVDPAPYRNCSKGSCSLGWSWVHALAQLPAAPGVCDRAGFIKDMLSPSRYLEQSRCAC